VVVVTLVNEGDSATTVTVVVHVYGVLVSVFSMVNVLDVSVAVVEG
jgi:hypothetical protein